MKGIIKPTWIGCRGRGIKGKTDAKDVITNELLDDVNKFDAEAVRAAARAYKPK